MSVFGEASIEAAAERIAGREWPRVPWHLLSSEKLALARDGARAGLAAAEGAVDREALAHTLARARWDRHGGDSALSLPGRYLAAAREDVAALFPAEGNPP